MEFNAPYNLVVDSNVCSPSTYAPQVATVGVAFCNYGDAPLHDVVAHIGNYAAQTPAVYPTRNSTTDAQLATTCLNGTGSYSFSHLGDPVDANRYIGTLNIGQCSWQYWSFTYPRRTNNDTCGSPVWCNTNDPNDDLWLNFDAWATSSEGAGVNGTWRATMRNEISANANKIFPNGGQWFNDPQTCIPGQTVTTNGVNYQLGNVGFGFDNDNDGSNDFNAWLQPIGDRNWNPACFRLVQSSGFLTINRSGGPTITQNFLNQLFFTDLPTDNTSITGTVYYTFMCLDGACAVPLTPYQEAASGRDNEKFAGDYGTQVGTLQSVQPNATLTKAVADTGTPTGTVNGRASAGERLNYTMALTNSETIPIGQPSFGMPLVLRDKIPTGTKFIGGTTTTNLAASTLYSVDNGVTWTSTQPGDPTLVTDLMWRLTNQLAVGATWNTSFAVTTNSPYTGNPVIVNTAKASFGDASPFLEASAAIPVQGTAAIGDFVWRDDGAGTPANSNNGVVDAGETGIANVSLSLYWDADSDGVLDADELQIATTTSGAAGSGCGGTGNYCFDLLAAGDYIVKVNKNDTDIPTGFRLTTPTPATAKDNIAVTVTTSTVATVDFGFGPSLTVGKSVSPSSTTDGNLVTYTLSATNIRPAATACTYTAWGSSLVSGDFVNSGNAINAAGPDFLYARGGEAGGGDVLAINTFGIGTPSGGVTATNLLLSFYVGGTIVNDDLDWTVTDVVGGQTQSGTVSTATLNTTIGTANQVTLSLPITILTTFAEVAGARISLSYKHNGSPDGIILYFDGGGFQVTTNQTCGAPGDDMVYVPITDTYDADALVYYDSSAPPTVNSISGTFPSRVGTLTWNIGPLTAGQTKTVTVRFIANSFDDNRPLLPLPAGDNNQDGEDDVIYNDNTASVTGALFYDGGAVNNASANASNTINPVGSISGTVWADISVDGLLNGGEVGIAFVTVELSNGTCTVGTNCPTTVTDASGNYIFTGLTGGATNYQVVVRTSTLPGGFTATGDPDKTTGLCSAVPLPTGGCDHRNTANLTLPLNDGNQANNNITGNNFGYNTNPYVFGTVWDDADGDGVQDPGEAPLAGVTLTMTSGCTVCSVVTDALGHYRFNNITAGTRTYSITAGTAGYAQTFDPDGPLNAAKDSFTVVAGSNGPFDFGYRRTGTSSIGDLVWADWDGDAVQDTGELGIANVTVTLYEDANGDGVRDCGTNSICGDADDVDAVRAVTQTNASGTYLFSNLPASTYLGASGRWLVAVDQTDPDLTGAFTALSQTKDPDQVGVCTVCDGRATVLTDGTNPVLTVDFGYKPVGFGSIGDLVWRDNNGNGLQDSGEPGIANENVTLYADTNNSGALEIGVDAVVYTATTTDLNGNYGFFSLPAYRYFADVDHTSSQIPTDAYGNRYVMSYGTDPLTINLANSQSYLAADWGFAPGATIGDRVYRDDNGDGSQGGTEPGLNNVSVQLYRDNDANGVFSVGDTLVSTVVTSTVNGNAGSYQFTGLAPGRYVVRVDQTDTDLPSTSFTADPNCVSYPCVGADGQYGANLAAAQNITFADFGVQPPNVLGDYIWIDSDADGVQDVTETGLAGVTVNLAWRQAGTTNAFVTTSLAVSTTTTDSSGNYTFGNLATNYLATGLPAEYRITVTAPSGYVQTFEKGLGGNGRCSSVPGGTGTCDLVVFSTMPGTALDIDFGFQAQARLTIDKDTSTPTVNRGGQASYTIRVTNAGGATATLVEINDALVPEGCAGVTCWPLASYTVAADPTVTRPTTPLANANPAIGATANLTWGYWTLPAGTSVTITYVVNVPAGATAGTYDNTATARFDSNGSGTLTAADTVVDDLGTTGQDADTPTGQDPEIDEDVTVPSSAMTILKTAALVPTGNGTVDAGETIEYTVVITNSGASDLHNVSINDAVPNGTTATTILCNGVAQPSCITSLRKDNLTTYADDFDPAAGYPNGSDGSAAWSTGWSGSNTRVTDQGDTSLMLIKSNSASRDVNLNIATAYRASLRFAVRRENIDTGDPLTIAIGATTLGVLDGTTLTGTACTPNPGGISPGQTDASYITVTCTIPTASLGAIRTLSFSTSAALDNSGEQFYVDDVYVEVAVRTTDTTGIAGDAPPALVPSSRGYHLLTSGTESMTVKFRVTANSNLLGINTISNTAFGDSDETAPVSSTADLTVTPAGTGSISGRVWEDADANGAINGGELGMDSIRVELYSDPSNNGVGAVLISQMLTDANGDYSFTGLPAGNYIVVVGTDSLPVSYYQTGDFDEVGTCSSCDSRTGNADLLTSSTALTGRNFGYDLSATPLPVTLSSFKAEAGGQGLVISWTTDTEVDNAGFYVMAKVGDDWVPLNRQIIRSKGVNSVRPLAYAFEAPYVAADEFVIFDVDLKGREHAHGPFPLGESNSSEPPTLKAIPWTSIRSEHAAKEKGRQNGWKNRDQPIVRLGVAKDGLYRVTYEALVAAGINMSKVNLAQLGLFDRNGSVPLWVDGTGNWGPGEAVEFYGKAYDSQYTDRNYYTLRVDNRALRIEKDKSKAPTGNTVTTYRETVKVNKQTDYYPAAQSTDPWYDQIIWAYYGPGSATLTVPIDNFVASGGDAKVDLTLWGFAAWPVDPDHHFTVAVNGQQVEEARFDGTATYTLSKTVPSSLLTEGNNTITINMPLDQGVDYDFLAVDTYGLSYPRQLRARDGGLVFDGPAASGFTVSGFPTSDVTVYRISGGKTERVNEVAVTGTPGNYSARFAGGTTTATYVTATGAKKLVPELLAAPPVEDIFTGQADYLVIAHPDFVSGIEPLVAQRRTEGHTTQVVDVQQVYENLSGGIPDPQAIRSFITYATKSKGTQSVLLVGGDTYDYKNYLNAGSVSFIPSLYVPTGDVLTFVPSDPLLGDTNGDLVPDVPVGRFPVRTSAELQSVIDKTLAYGNKTYRRSFLSATDSYDSWQRISFKQKSEELIPALPGWSINHADIETLGVAGARQQIVDAWNGGVSFAQYFGHSSYSLWSFDDLFDTNHIGLLTEPKPTVVAQWGCWNTYYVQPWADTLGHVLMLSGPQGAAAVLGAAGLTDTASDVELGKQYLSRIVQPGMSIGWALINAKRELAMSHPEMNDVIRSWTILGDPTLVVEPNTP